MTFAELIKNARIKKGLKQAEVAQLVGVSTWAYQKWEYGRPIMAGNAMRLAEVLGLDLEEIKKSLLKDSQNS